jgi:hypothetical protein
MNDSLPVAARQPMQVSPVSDVSEFAELLDSNRFAQIQRVAKLFSESDLIPQVFQGKPANCAVALQMAFRMHVDPMMLMQNMYIVHGKPGIEAKLAIALINQRGPFTGPVQWKTEGEGKTRKWTAYATHRSTGEKCEAVVTWEMAVAEGWTTKTGSKWMTIPDLMGRYRSAMFLGRLYCPEVLLGLPTDDELRDIGQERVVIGQRISDAAPNAIERFNEQAATPVESVVAVPPNGVLVPVDFESLENTIRSAKSADDVDVAMSLIPKSMPYAQAHALVDAGRLRKIELEQQ